MIRAYYVLTKPGIILGNIITAACGFVLASQGHIDYGLFLATLAGLSLIIASACVCNNYIDRSADRKMSRTKDRPLATGAVSGAKALVFAAILGLGGVWVLARYNNSLTSVITLTGFAIYVIVYTLWKYRSVYGTIVGSISGAVPPVAGYCAVSNRFDSGALLLFLIIVLWQMPHFFAIAIYRLEDYAAASIPVLPLRKGIRATKIQMLIYIAIFTITTSMLTFFGYTGYAFLSIALLLGACWLGICTTGFFGGDDRRWARNMFIFSLLTIMGFSFAIVLD